ncbi:MAG: hypothetical protein JNM98_17765 [Rhodocyclaceae bacterium]|nr:hypothetical protein [Rhodocyclaceae bacterium]
MAQFTQNALFWSLLAAAALTAGLAVWLSLRASSGAALPAMRPGAGCLGRLVRRGWIGRLVEALVYLASSREARYATPWILVLGDRGAGKTSLVRSMVELQADLRPPKLAAPDLSDCEGAAFGGGVLLDPAGRLWSSEAEGGDTRQKKKLLDAIDQLRPERPLDKIVLVVSARALLGGERALQDDARRALGALEDIRRRFDFALPVYVVVTQCDAVPGFSAFWKAQPEELRRQMVGWSAPPAIQSQPREKWPENAFAVLEERLRVALLDYAARPQAEAGAAADAAADDVDQVFLFPVAFRRLAAPLARWFQVAFQPDEWSQSYFCRGIYFTGSVTAASGSNDGPRKDVDFLADLLTERLFGEAFLALPTRQSIWSRNSLIRRVQYATLVLAVALLGWLGLAGLNFHRQMQDLDHALLGIKAASREAGGSGCLDGWRVHRLLQLMAPLQTRSAYAAIPLSWFDDRVVQESAQELSEQAFRGVIMPAIACRMAQKAKDLALPPAAFVSAAAGAQGETLSPARQDYLDYLHKVAELEQQLGNFALVARPGRADEMPSILRAFKHLTVYAFDRPLSSEVEHERGALSAALAAFTYDTPVPLPPKAREIYAENLGRRFDALRSAVSKELDTGAKLLAELPRRADDSQMRSDAAHLLWWLNWIRESWLGADREHNPCADLARDSRRDRDALAGRSAYGAVLTRIDSGLANGACFDQAMLRLASMHVAPYGALFKLQDRKLFLSDSLAPELTGIAALADLPYMRIHANAGFRRLPEVAGWDAAVLSEAAGYAHQYLSFAKARGLPPTGSAEGKRALFDRLARRHLLALLSDRMSAAQLPPLPLVAQAGVNGLSADERRLARSSADFAGAVGPLVEVLDLYAQLGFTVSGREIAQFARGLALDELARARGLAATSRLYDPGPPAEGGFPGAPELAVTKDWLARQVARAGVLAGYASQYVAFLKNSQGFSERPWDDQADAVFWDNTVAELERYVQFKDPAGQVANLDAVFVKLVPALNDSGCRKQLADFPQPDFGNDLFSRLRKSRLTDLRDMCTHRYDAPLLASYRDLAAHFERELAGRFPFAGGAERDAAPLAVKAFLADYAARREDLKNLADGLPRPRQVRLKGFMEQMDQVAAFFLGNLAQAPAAMPLTAAVRFNTLPRQSRGANQVLAWTLSAPAGQAVFPGKPGSLDWSWNQPITLRLDWASGSVWRPVADSRQSELAVSGVSASFGYEGPWALLRMIAAHRLQSAADPLDPLTQALEFSVPVVAIDGSGPAKNATARLFMSVQLSDRKQQGGLIWPAFPTSLPNLDSP